MTALDRLKAVYEDVLHKHPSTGVIVNYSDLAKLIAVVEKLTIARDLEREMNSPDFDGCGGSPMEHLEAAFDELEAALAALKEPT